MHFFQHELGILTADEVDEIVTCALEAGFCRGSRRMLLLADLPTTLVAVLPEHVRCAEQIRGDVQELNRITAFEGCGRPPLAIWLGAARAISAGRPDSRRFKALAEIVEARAAMVPAVAVASVAARRVDHAVTIHANRNTVGVNYGTIVLGRADAVGEETLGSGLAPPPDALPLGWRAPPPPPPPRPETPYPLLDPFRDPRTFGGRDAEVDLLIDRLTRPRGLNGLYSPSGYGKSSLLLAGLIPRLGAMGHPVAMHRRPDVPGLGRRLLRAMVEVDVPPLPDDDPRPFAAWVERLARERPGPIFVLDQFESIFKTRDPGAKLRVGLLLAATVDPGHQGEPVCRWLLSYREEFHGTVQRWLANVLEGGPAGLVERLPGNLVPDDTLAAIALPAIGGMGRGDPVDDLRDAIARPLAVSAGEPWVVVGDGLDRLAEAFAAARRQRPDAPLLPELQVVLNRLVVAAEGHRLSVPRDVTALIDGALREHLVGTLQRLFVSHPNPIAARTMALLALRRLADAMGRRREGGLRRAGLRDLADDEVLDALAAWNARLVIPQGEGSDARVSLSHDRLAEVLVGIHDAEVFGAEDGFDPALIEVARIVGQRALQFAETGDSAMLSIGAVEFRTIATHLPLLWDERRRRWWAALLQYRRCRRRQRFGVALAAALAAALIGWRFTESQRAARLAAARAQIERSWAPDAILAGIEVLIEDGERDEVIARIIDEAPLATAEGAPDSPVERARARFIRQRIAGARPPRSAEDFGRLIAGVELAAHPETPAAISREERRRLRGELRAALTQQFPGARPPIEWRAIEGGTFMMGDERGKYSDELPVHRVHVSTFELARSEVTIGQYRYFDAEGLDRNIRIQDTVQRRTAQFGDDAVHYAAWMVNWYEAWAFALWVDPEGRLPTEAEWEFAARGGVKAPAAATQFWAGDTKEHLAEVGWFDENSGELPRPVCHPPTPRPHPLGLCDIAGGLMEWTVDYYTEAYPPGPAKDPVGARQGQTRIYRGGSFMGNEHYARSAARNGAPPTSRTVGVGLRVARSVDR